MALAGWLMKMLEVQWSKALVANVYVDDLTRIVLLQLGQRLVRRIRRYLCRLLATTVIEIDDQLRITGKAFGCGDVLDAVLRP